MKDTLAKNTQKVKRWISRVENVDLDKLAFEQQSEDIRQALQVSSLVSQLLVLRGQATPANAHLYLWGGLKNLPDAFSMLGMEKAVQRILASLDRGKVPYLSGDFDVDGTTSIALLSRFFKTLGFDAPAFIPHREKDGYGLSAEMIKRVAAEGCELLITADCGISAEKEIELANNLGIDVIVCDHHQPGETLPPAYTILNPHQKGCSFPYKDLCGVGVVFFLALALRKRLREMGRFNQNYPEPNLKPLLPLVALGTVCDLVPLTGTNRLLVQSGLKEMVEKPEVGITALIEVSGIKKITAGALGYYLGPRLNAAGRLDSADIGLQLLLATDPARAKDLAVYLDRLNRERQGIEKEVLKKAIARIEQGECPGRTIVLASELFHPGVQGIVASNLVEKYYRPTVLISLDGRNGKGSGRSIKGFHLYKALQQCSSFLEKYGGHEFAAGLSIDENNITSFAQSLETVAQQVLSEEDLIPKVMYDLELTLGDINEILIDNINWLAPFGSGNPSPVFLARGVETEQVRTIKDKHLRFIVKQNGVHLEAIAFGMANRINEVMTGRIDMIFQAELNIWNNQKTVQCGVKDIRIATEFAGSHF